MVFLDHPPFSTKKKKKKEKNVKVGVPLPKPSGSAHDVHANFTILMGHMNFDVPFRIFDGLNNSLYAP